MNDLIKVTTKVFKAEEVQAVDARELHAFLHVGTDFPTWIKAKVNKFGFEKDSDFVVIQNSQENLFGGRPKQDVFVTIDMAKELSMMENNDQGRKARKYFIACEKMAKDLIAKQSIVPTNMKEALKLAYEQQCLIEEQSEKILELEPKGQFADTLINTEKWMDFKKVAKELNFIGMGRNNLLEFLRIEGKLMQTPNHNEPYQEYVNKGYFKLIPVPYVKKNGVSGLREQPVCSMAGMEYVEKLLRKAGHVAVNDLEG